MLPMRYIENGFPYIDLYLVFIGQGRDVLSYSEFKMKVSALEYCL